MLAACGIGEQPVVANAVEAARQNVPACAVGGEATAGNDFLGVICWSLYTIGLQPYAARIDITQLSAITLVGGAIPLLVVSAPALMSTNWSAVGIGGWLAVFYSSVISMGVAYFFWYRGLRVLGPTRTAVYSNLQPIVALLVAWAFLSETPTIFQGVGAATIIAGVFLTRA